MNACAQSILLPSPMPMLSERRDDHETEDNDEDRVVQTVVAAAGLPPPRTRAPASIFSMADAAKVARALKAHGRFGDAAGFETRGTTCRDGAVVRHVGASYPSNRWDEERLEKERERRARQKPPKPVKRARTRGKKVRQWDGEAEE